MRISTQCGLWEYHKGNYINKLFDIADVVIAIGYDIIELNPSKWNKDKKINIIHVSVEESHVNQNYQPEVQVIGDIKDSIFQILRRSAREGEPTFALELKKKIEKGSLSIC